MPIDPASLPRDPDRLIEIIVALQDRNAHLEGMVAALKRTVYGPRSEKFLSRRQHWPQRREGVRGKSTISDRRCAWNFRTGYHPI